MAVRILGKPCASLCRGCRLWHKVTRHKVTRHKVGAQGWTPSKRNDANRLRGVRKNRWKVWFRLRGERICGGLGNKSLHFEWEVHEKCIMQAYKVEHIKQEMLQIAWAACEKSSKKLDFAWEVSESVVELRVKVCILNFRCMKIASCLLIRLNTSSNKCCKSFERRAKRGRKKLISLERWANMRWSCE